MKYFKGRNLILELLILFFLVGIGIASYTWKNNSEIRSSRSKNKAVIKPKIHKINLGNNHYWVVLPGDFNKNKKYPVIIYLHGRKYDPPHVDRAKLHLKYKWLKNIKRFNFILALPTLPLKSYPTWTTRDNGFIKNVIVNVLTKYNQSTSPVFLSGFSAGALHSIYIGLNEMIYVNGIGAFAYGLAHPLRNVSEEVKKISIFLAVGKFDHYTRGNVRYSYRVLKNKKFKDVIFKEYKIGHWVHDDFIKDLKKWVLKRTKIFFNKHNSLSLRTQN